MPKPNVNIHCPASADHECRLPCRGSVCMLQERKQRERSHESIRSAFALNLPRGWQPTKPLCTLAAHQLVEHLASPDRSHLPPEAMTLLLELVAWLEHRAPAAADVVEHVSQGVAVPADMVERAYAGGRK